MVERKEPKGRGAEEEEEEEGGDASNSVWDAVPVVMDGGGGTARDRVGESCVAIVAVASATSASPSDSGVSTPAVLMLPL